MLPNNSKEAGPNKLFTALDGHAVITVCHHSFSGTETEHCSAIHNKLCILLINTKLLIG